jgi:hypothetical protein
MHSSSTPYVAFYHGAVTYAHSQALTHANIQTCTRAHITQEKCRHDAEEKKYSALYPSCTIINAQKLSQQRADAHTHTLEAGSFFTIALAYNTTIAYFVRKIRMVACPIRNIRSYSPSMTDLFFEFPRRWHPNHGNTTREFFLLFRELVTGESLVTAPRNSSYVVAVAPHILSQLTTKTIAIDDGSFCHVSEKCFSFTSPRNSACSRPGGSRRRGTHRFGRRDTRFRRLCIPVSVTPPHSVALCVYGDAMTKLCC